MSEKLLAVMFIAAVAATIPFTGLADNIRSTSQPKPALLKSVEGVAATSTDNEPQVLSLQVTPAGFEPGETIAHSGKFLILLQNRTGRRDLNFWLAREGEARVVESEAQKRDWKAQVQLGPGIYIVGETNHPEWQSIIRVTN